MAKQVENEAFVDELMGFDPSTVTAFQEDDNTPKGNPHLYKTNPLKVDQKISPDGHYHAKVRIIYNPHNMKQSIVKNVVYSFRDSDGFFMMDSKLAMGDRQCRIFKDWKTLHFDKDEVTQHNIDGVSYTTKSWGDHMFDKSESQYVLVQIIEDNNQPDLVGQFKVWRLPKVVFDILQAKMNPTDKSKTPQDLMNYLFGPVLELDVTPGPDDPAQPERKQREIKYTLCAFEADPTPIITVTGEDLFTEDERDMINDYASAKKVITDPKASVKKKDEATAKCKSLVEPLKLLMSKAMEYVKDNAPDVDKEFGYHEPTQEQWNRYEKWVKNVKNFIDPITALDEGTGKGEPESYHTESAPALANDEDDLPF